MLTIHEAAYLADLLGRKKAVASGTIIILAGMVLQGTGQTSRNKSRS